MKEVSKSLLSKEGNSLKYTLTDGTVIKKFRKAWERNEDGCLDKVMIDWTANPHKATVADALIEEDSE